MMRKLKLEELGRVDVETYQQQNKIPVVVLCDNIRSMHNVGSIFRTADAFSIEKIHLCGITARPPHKEIRKTALGSTESVDWDYHENASEILKDLISQDYTPIAIEQVDKSVSLESFTVENEKKYVIILGNEVEGVQQDLIDMCNIALEIPQSGTKHSLNVSVCSGIVMWKFYQAFLDRI
ncbi:RNA methyltransferase [Weeksellaceae bacterium KMM 9713]|uniref:RNA methyltransferase n=1 Tax=Profundicola chukchiensis TaxID=2961959 RepID=A0A9X4MZ15_9FLAO|nr:RNA methyltransferase [Profundicola chukchiensis]MDG4944951.1 RNA methyltransferase [Profundicola chukchiensis]